MTRRKLLLLTLAISTAIHLALATGFLWLDNSASSPPAQTAFKVSLQQQQAASKPATPPRQPPEEVPAEKVLSAQDTAAQQQIDDTDTPAEPPPEETPEPQAVTEPEPEPEETTPEQPQKTEDVAAQSQVAETRSQAAIAGQQNTEHNSALEAAKQNYLGLVAEHINSYKYYPRSAIRRGTEGLVEVSFSLQTDGSIKNLHTQGEHSVLLSASQRSIEQALPMPQRPENLVALGPIQIKFSMKYFLHEQ